MNLQMHYNIMNCIAAELEKLPKVHSCVLKGRKFSDKCFIRLKFDSGCVYGISYVSKKHQFALWDNYGKFKDYSEQRQVFFDYEGQLIEWISKVDVDAYFTHVLKSTMSLAWSKYDELELERKYGEVQDLTISRRLNDISNKD